MTHISARIKGLMHDNKITSFYQFSKKIGIPAPTLLKIVNYGVVPRHTTLIKICEFFNVPIEELTKTPQSQTSPVKSLDSLAKILSYLMTERHLGQRELGRGAGVAQQIISKILSGKSTHPSSKTLQKIADFFELTVDQITGKSPLPKKYMKPKTRRKYSVPVIEWRSLTLLPDILSSEPSEQLLSTFHGKGVFATKVPPTGSAQSKIVSGEIIVVDYYTKIRPGNLYIVQTSDDIYSGTLVNDNGRSLFLLDTNQRRIELKKKQYRVLGEILETIQIKEEFETPSTNEDAEESTLVEKIELAKSRKHMIKGRNLITSVDIYLLDYIIFQGISLFSGKVDSRELIDHCYEIYNSVSRITATFEEKEKLINLSLNSLNEAIPKKDASLNKAS